MKLTKKKTFLSIGFLIATIASISTAFAFGGHHKDPSKRADHIVEKVAKKLSLNTEQKDKLIIVKEAALSMHQKMHENKQGMEQDILSIVGDSTLDESLILDRINTKTETIRTQAPEMVAALAQFYNSLDAQQQETVRAKIQKKVKRMSKRD
jgi:periplasmic protein CpxP/Spy